MARNIALYKPRLPGFMSLTASKKSTATKMTTEDAEKKQASAPREKNISDKAFLQEALQAHNKYRKKHKSPELVLDDDLCDVAQAYARVLSKTNQNFGYSGNGFGENIFFTTEGPVGGKAAADAWYTESRRFDWKNIDRQKGTSHFTQMIWKGTKKMGISMATGKYGIYVVANYSPPGNIAGQYANNIAPPGGGKKS